jgi:hypothetical protein
MPEPTDAGKVPDQDAEVEFEGMRLKQKAVDRILLIRKQGATIIEGIDLEHVLTYPALIQAFETALARAKREHELDKALAPKA